jgi:hypothetical protein
VNSIEADADLLAACRTRRALLDDLDRADERAAYAEIRDVWTPSELDIDPIAAIFEDDSRAHARRLRRQIAKLDRAIADAVMDHLLDLPAVGSALMMFGAASGVAT